MLANWPWTLLIVAPTNAALLATAADAAGPDSRALIAPIGGLVHSGRTALATAALAIYLWSVARAR